MAHRLEVALKEGIEDPIGNRLLKEFKSHGYKANSIRTIEAYLVDSPKVTGADHLKELGEKLFVDPVLNDFSIDSPLGKEIGFDWYVEVGFKAGVTDNAARVARENLSLLTKEELTEKDPLASARAFLIKGDLTREEVTKAASELMVNHLIQTEILVGADEWEAHLDELYKIPHTAENIEVKVENPDCSSLEQLMILNKERLLALSEEEGQVIVDYFSQPEVQKARLASGMSAGPTDVELELLAQTWSEHCKHKIFNAHIEYTDENGKVTEIKSLYKSYIQACTKEIRAGLGKDDWCLSVFKDNAGIIKFDEDYSLAFKVETHNSPSALDPYGGALTGIVGVNRDAFGTGMGAQLIANTDVFCFGPPDYDKPLPKKLMHPSRIFEGVRLGVEHGGNHSGVPTVNGAIVFDDCFVGKPLVFCGTLSIMPAKHVGQPSEDKKALPGDHILMTGGRIGKDGIHGATFSSLALDEDSPVSAVQIGDPITQRKMFDFLWVAKEENLYSCITDNGAGGLSSSVGEMSEDSGGCKLHLDRAPLKYQGLQPWEILVSEAQERMTLSVPPAKVERFLALAKAMHVEASDLGTFTDSGDLECFYEGKLVCKMSMDFVHDGLPPMKLKAKWDAPNMTAEILPKVDASEALKKVLARPNVASKEKVIRQYDHEVGGASVIKPLVGVNNDGPGNAGVLRPILASTEGIIVSNGLAPKYSPFDAYHMAACSVDEAVRNIVATGGSLERVAGLDNFCWPDPVESETTPDGQYKLAQLVRSCQALYDYCKGFGVPLISGKDSMKNDANLDGQKISIKPTLLFSAVGKIKDITKSVTSDVKNSGQMVYILGDTKNELAGSEFATEYGLAGGLVPQVDLETAKKRYETLSGLTAKGVISAAHDCSDGGLAVTLAEMAFGGGFGIEVDISVLAKMSEITPMELLFSESASRLVVIVDKENRGQLESAFTDQAIHFLGYSNCQPELVVHNGEETLLEASLADLKTAWQSTLG